MISGTLSELWEFYGETFRLHAHQLLAWAYRDVRSRLHSDMEEPAMTGLLAEAMKARLDVHPDTPDEYLHYCVGDQEPVSPQGQLGNDRLRLDLTLIRSDIRPRLSYIMEAKRLKTGGFPIGKYAGSGGMGDFLSCNYAPDAPEASLVGLSQNKDPVYWNGELQRIFDEAERDDVHSLKALTPPNPVKVIAEFPDETRSEHLRENGSRLVLFHILLDCRNL